MNTWNEERLVKNMHFSTARLRHPFFALLASFLACCAAANADASVSPQRHVVRTTESRVVLAAAPASSPSPSDLVRTDPLILQSLARQQADLENIQKKVEALQSAWWKTILQTIVGGLVGGILAAASAWVLQRAKLKHDQAVAREQTELTVAKSIVDWRLQQLEHLYGPLHILLGQSKGLYRQMNALLLERDSLSYRFEPDEASSDGQTFYAKVDSGWEPFRLVKQFPKVYKQDKGVDYLIDQMISTGTRIVSVTETNAGLALPQQDGLADAFAAYLAHFSILRQVHDSIRAGIEVPPIMSEAAFPRHLPVLIAEGRRILAGALNDWEKRIAPKTV